MSQSEDRRRVALLRMNFAELARALRLKPGIVIRGVQPPQDWVARPLDEIIIAVEDIAGDRFELSPPGYCVRIYPLEEVADVPD